MLQIYTGSVDSVKNHLLSGAIVGGGTAVTSRVIVGSFFLQSALAYGYTFTLFHSAISLASDSLITLLGSLTQSYRKKSSFLEKSLQDPIKIVSIYAAIKIVNIVASACLSYLVLSSLGVAGPLLFFAKVSSLSYMFLVAVEIFSTGQSVGQEKRIKV